MGGASPLAHPAPLQHIQQVPPTQVWPQARASATPPLIYIYIHTYDRTHMYIHIYIHTYILCDSRSLGLAVATEGKMLGCATAKEVVAWWPCSTKPYLCGHQAGRVVRGGILHNCFLLGRLLHHLCIWAQRGILVRAPEARGEEVARLRQVVASGTLQGSRACRSRKRSPCLAARPVTTTWSPLRTKRLPPPLGLAAGTHRVQLRDVEELQ